MKISEMTNDQATEAMIRLSAPMANICEDEELVKILDQAQRMKKEPVIKTIGAIIPKLIMFGLKNHKQDVYEIIAALMMTSSVKVSKMNFAETVQCVKESYDDILRSFFTSYADAVKRDGNASV